MFSQLLDKFLCAFRAILPVRRDYPAKEIVSLDYDYLYNLRLAADRTKQMGLESPYFVVDEDFKPDLQELSDYVQEVINNEIIAFGGRVPLLGHCYLYSQLLCEHLERRYQRPMLLTSGHLIDQYINSKVYFEAPGALRARLNRPPESKMHLHAWVTLPDLTIIDVTLTPVLKELAPHKYAKYGAFYFKNVRGQLPDHEFCYQPAVLGIEYWKRVSPEFPQREIGLG